MSPGTNSASRAGGPKVIGLLGGIASGKSVVAQLLQDLGARVLDADRLGHEVLRMPEIRQAVLGRWGRAVLGANEELDRHALAKIVFAPPPDGPQELAYLEAITHPEISRLMSLQLEPLRAAGAVPAVVLDAPVLLKAGWDDLCDRIVYVDAPRETRLSRAVARGWSAEDFAAREAAQEPLEVKRARADLVLDNSGSIESTRDQVEHFWQSVIRS